MIFKNCICFKLAAFLFVAMTDIYALASAVTVDSIFVEGHIDEVRVASTKTNRHNLTPASVSLVGPAILRTQNLTEVSELSGFLPNVFIPEYGSKQTTPIAIRGIMSKQKGTAVGFYVNGMPHFEISSFDTDMLDVKAIEIFRGPQGTLYGRNTLGGVVNIYTYSPFEHHGTKLRVGLGNYNNLNAQFSNYTRCSDVFGFCVGGYYKHKGGYFNNEFLDKKADKSDEVGAKVGLYWRPTNALNIKLTSNIDYIDQGGYPYAPYDIMSDKLSPVSYNRECGFNRLLSTSGVGVSYSYDNLSFNSQTTFQWLDENMKMDQDYTSDDKYFSCLDFGQYAISEELTVKTEGDGRLQWVAGLFFFRQSRDYLSDMLYVQQAYSSINDYTMPTTGAALFAQVSYNIWRGLSLTAGLRFDYEKSQDDYCNSVRKDGTCTVKKQFDSDLTTNDFLPKFGLQYKWHSRNVAFVNVTRGCKAGGFNAVFDTDAERTYDDEFNWNYEAGIKATSSDRKIGGDLSLFFIDWRRQHISRTMPGVGNVIYNAGHSSSRGIEATIVARPVVGLMLQANYGYTYAKFIDYKKSDSQDFSGNMIPLVPRNTLSAIASYSFAPRHLLDLVTFSANYNGVGKLYWLEDNAVQQPFYSQLGAKIALQKGLTTLELWGKNITDTKYLSYYFESSAKYAQGGQPATFGATLNIAI